jgi:hypothetical protein
MQVRYLYLFDTCALINYYRKDPAFPDIAAKFDYLFEQKGLNCATLFMPNFCIAEIFNTFARLRYRDNVIKNVEEYTIVKNAFRHQVRKGALISEYPLHIYHIYNADYIIPFEHQWDIGRFKQQHLSTFDILIIGMGIELVKHFGDDNVRIITCDSRLESLCTKLRQNVNDVIKEKYEIPKSVIYPQAINLKTVKKEELPSVEGQRL